MTFNRNKRKTDEIKEFEKNFDILTVETTEVYKIAEFSQILKPFFEFPESRFDSSDRLMPVPLPLTRGTQASAK